MMTEQEFLKKLEDLVRCWQKESKTFYMSDVVWEEGYNKAFEIAAEQVKDLLKQYKGEGKI